MNICRSEKAQSLDRSRVRGDLELAAALKAAEGLRLRANRKGRDIGEPKFGALIERFIIEEKLRDAKNQPRAIGDLLMSSKRDANSKVVRMAMRSTLRQENVA